MDSMWAWLAVLIGLTLWIRLAFDAEIQACRERDPAATNIVEILLTYSGLHAIVAYRLAHRLSRLHVPVLPRLVSQVARMLTGVEIHPGAVIGHGLFIDHGMGVVIGETTIIGNHVTLFQGVTLGGTGKEQGKRHPTIGHKVVIGSGAKVLGNITIGDNATVGANAVVIRDVPASSTVVGVPGRIARTEGRSFPGMNLDHTALPDPVAERLEKLQHEIDAVESHLKSFKQRP